ncbi:MAG: alpha beta-hydrolase [Lasallia pustulata]|uniref:Alpha beta-hydrolase n=1 Tax=Lasallia pustulata TaxID=136370 RepID=A0A5M8Q0T5_9LECA|nr:MAG: alpha beta-hydrolase [Lasallia pustulata]
MIDHVLGRPSVKFRKIQVFAVVSFWSLYLFRGNHHGPPILRKISRRIDKRLTAWQTLVITLLYLYVCRNFAKIVGLECPEPLANLYSRAYFRATWVTTALDAGFWTAMKIRKKWLRDLASMLFTFYYLIAAEQADEKVRKVRGTLTIEHLRVSWNKANTPYISFLTRLLRPKLANYPPRAIRIPRPAESSYREPVNAWLYFDGPLSALQNHTKVILDIPGGGFVAMDPRTNDDKLLAWSGRLGLPILSLDYRKAPEYPYPYALNECYDVYHTLVASRGRCVGLSGAVSPRIIVTGDSAGGNLATGVVLMVLQSAGTDSRVKVGQETLPVPEGLILIYPGLDMNIGNWMTDEQMALIQDRRVRKTNMNVLRRKSEDYSKLTEGTPHPSFFFQDDAHPSSPRTTDAPSPPDTEPKNPLEPESHLSEQPDSSAAHLIPLNNINNIDNNTTNLAKSTPDIANQTATVASSKPQQMKTRLAMSSMISYFNDRILTPEMMRAMIILYVGPHNRPDFSTDFLLSPLLAPEALLAKFPKTYFLTGERDPLVDDTVIMAGRLRQAKHDHFIHRKEFGLLKSKAEFDEKEHVEVALIPGISHGFLQFVGVFPEAWKHIFRVARWMEEVYAKGDTESDPEPNGHMGHATRVPKINSNLQQQAVRDDGGYYRRHHHHHHRRGLPPDSQSSADEDRPLEMSSSLRGSAGGQTGLVHANGRAKGRAGRREQDSTDEGGRRRKPGLARKTSTVSLASEEDILARRMVGLAGG